MSWFFVSRTFLQIAPHASWTDIIGQKLEGWWLSSIRMLPNLLLAIVFWAFFFLVAKLFKRFGYPLAQRFSKSRAIGGLISELIYICIIVFGLYVGLDVLKLNKIAVSLLAGAGIVGLTLAFAFQDLTSNFISGVYIDFNKPFDIGDIIETNGIVGTVEEIGLRSTALKTNEGTYLMMPNKNIFQNTLINHSRTAIRQVKVDFEMTIQEAAATIAPLVAEAVSQVRGVDHAYPPQCYYTDIDGGNLKMSVFFWVRSPVPAERIKTRHQVIMAVLKAFQDHGIKRLG